jgi:hypothetical protein
MADSKRLHGFCSTPSGSGHATEPSPGLRGKSTAPPGAIHLRPLRGPQSPKSRFTSKEDRKFKEACLAFSNIGGSFSNASRALGWCGEVFKLRGPAGPETFCLCGIPDCCVPHGTHSNPLPRRWQFGVRRLWKIGHLDSATCRAFLWRDASRPPKAPPAAALHRQGASLCQPRRFLMIPPSHQ